MFGNIFENIGSIFENKVEEKRIPLKRKNDINYELKLQTSNIEKKGNKVIYIDQNRYGESVIIYQLLHHDGLDKYIIHLCIKVITQKGVKTPDSKAFLNYNPDTKHINIADIRIEGERVNCGYGSILMNGIMQLVEILKVRYITGWISSVDWNHIDRSEHFYNKFGFECTLNHAVKYGTITWINQELGATREELEELLLKEE